MSELILQILKSSEDALEEEIADLLSLLNLPENRKLAICKANRRLMKHLLSVLIKRKVELKKRRLIRYLNAWAQQNKLSKDHKKKITAHILADNFLSVYVFDGLLDFTLDRCIEKYPRKGLVYLNNAWQGFATHRCADVNYNYEQNIPSTKFGPINSI